MGLVTWILLGVIVLVAIGLGVGVFFGGLLRGAEIVGQNPAVQNASEEAKQFIDDKTDSIASSTTTTTTSLISVTTDRSDYERGDPVLITVKINNNDDENNNSSSGTQTFPDAALGLRIKNTDTNDEYSVMAAQVVTDLGSDESKTITWQDDSAPAGNYVASVHTLQGASAQASFEIKE
ncbi:MAG TPA: hypothetical protein VJP79_08415 [Nitrososphaera sp.]|nr:hypothetical protein [Nitrososphaera sp.]